ARVSATHPAAELGGHGFAPLGCNPLAGILNCHVRFGKVENAAIGKIQSRREIRVKLALEDQAKAARIKRVTSIGKSAGIHIRQEVSASSCDISGTEQRSVIDVVLEYGDL